MKPTLQVIPNEDNTGYIVIMEKDMNHLEYDIYAQQQEIKKFRTTERKVFIETIDMAIRKILDQFGIIPFDTSESALKSAFDTLNRHYGKTIEIIDRYDGIKGLVVDKENYITVIIENGILSCANEIKVVDYVK